MIQLLCPRLTPRALAATALIVGQLAGSASAANYFVVTPVKVGAAAPSPAPDIAIGLAGATLPLAWAGEHFSHSFLPYVSVFGDPDMNPSELRWSLANGADGLSIGEDGSLQGTPRRAARTQVAVQVSYRGKLAEQSYALEVRKQLRQAAGTRTWSDGTLAGSCLDYRTDRDGQAYRGATGNGVYRIDVDGAGALAPVDVLCDMTTDGGGWTVFQARQDGTVNFLRGWSDYAQGFGSAAGEYWLGNDRIAALTAGGAQLAIDMTRFNGQSISVSYSDFAVGAEDTNYRLTATGYSGAPAVDALATHNGAAFGTIDRDNDESDKFNCAATYTGAWWFRNCHNSNLNGLYLGSGKTDYGKGMVWSSFTGYTESLAATRMKLRER